ncbi:hypothetical protein C8F01DRAFT_259784 [Mycena amicta]|nr:hypothetical protein C8F01DRAFT_259784 [Mycena amicta]
MLDSCLTRTAQLQILSNSTTTMFLFLLTPILTVTATAIPSLETTARDVDSCRFTLRSKQYDICPILTGAAADNNRERVRGTATDDRVWQDWPWTTQCRSGTRYCTIIDASGSEPEKGLFPLRAAPSGSTCYSFSKPSDAHVYVLDSLIVELLRTSGGPSIAVRLICDPAVELERSSSSEQGASWRTKHACPLSHPRQRTIHTLFAEADADPADDNSSEPPQNDEDSEDDSEQLLDGRNRSSRRSTAIIFVVISLTVISIGVFTYKRPHFIVEHMQPVLALIHQVHVPSLSLPASFSLPKALKRTGEGRLVRWAEEDLELDAEDDVMVNGGDAYDELDFDVGDEYIPLRPSPRKGGA